MQPVSIQLEVSGGSVENVNRVASGQMDLAMAIASTMYQAQRGEGDRECFVRTPRDCTSLCHRYTHPRPRVITG